VELTPEQYGRIAPLLPGQRGHAGLSNLQVIRTRVEALGLDSTRMGCTPTVRGL